MAPVESPCTLLTVDVLAMSKMKEIWEKSISLLEDCFKQRIYMKEHIP
jgi:hypothetical protein